MALRDGANRGGPDQDGTGLHGENRGLDVAGDFGILGEFKSLAGVDVAIDAAMNHHALRANLGVDGGTPTDRDRAIGEDFSVDLAVDDDVVLKLDGPFDLDIREDDIGPA